MWSDNETSEDLLGFAVHKDLIKRIVTTDSLLPVTVGVFGDWGGGKSSIMRMLEKDFESSDYENVACLYFNGWVFEGYDDAKAALISSILIQLGEHKRIGPKIRTAVASMLKQADYFRGAKMLFRPIVSWAAAAGTAMVAGAAGVDPSTAAVMAPVAAAAASGALSATASNGKQLSSESLDKEEKTEGERIDWQELIKNAPGTPGPLDIRTFREDFQKLLADTDLRSVIVLIDDIDRCSPERLIENLEAIKLFLAVPKTAFVIAADLRIVRHAIAKRYGAEQLRNEQPARDTGYDLVTDYLEKLIQVPYRLPKLSPSEIETYMTLLFCQLHLTADGRFEAVRSHCEAERKKNLYKTYGTSSVLEALATELPQPLAQSLEWTSTIAPSLAGGLKGNPRQVKRFLNALILRTQLAEVASLDIDPAVLVKLMLLEYTFPDLFDKLYEWQAVAEGHPPKLRELEEQARETAADGEAQSHTAAADDANTLWQQKPVQGWLRLEPPLANVDLRDYFWVSRDRLTSTVSSLTMVPPFVRRLFEELIADNPGQQQVAARQAKELDIDEFAALLRLLEHYLRRQPELPGGTDGLIALANEGFNAALETLIRTLDIVPTKSLAPNVAFDLQTLAITKPESRTSIMQVLTGWSKTDTGVGNAAGRALKELEADAAAEPSTRNGR